MNPVKIWADEGKDMTVSPTSKHVHRGDLVEWVSKDDEGEFLLTFYDGTPFEEGNQIESHGHKARAQVLSDAAFRAYPYDTALAKVSEGQRVSLYATAGSPEIIVD